MEFIGTTKISKKDIENFVIKLYSVGFSLRDIEKIVGVSFMTAKRILERNGIKRRKR